MRHCGSIIRKGKNILQKVTVCSGYWSYDLGLFVFLSHMPGSGYSESGKKLPSLEDEDKMKDAHLPSLAECRETFPVGKVLKICPHLCLLWLEAEGQWAAQPWKQELSQPRLCFPVWIHSHIMFNSDIR